MTGLNTHSRRFLRFPPAEVVIMSVREGIDLVVQIGGNVLVSGLVHGCKTSKVSGGKEGQVCLISGYSTVYRKGLYCRLMRTNRVKF